MAPATFRQLSPARTTQVMRSPTPPVSRMLILSPLVRTTHLSAARYGLSVAGGTGRLPEELAGSTPTSV
jgi:hypothetical protein